MGYIDAGLSTSDSTAVRAGGGDFNFYGGSKQTNTALYVAGVVAVAVVIGFVYYFTKGRR